MQRLAHGLAEAANAYHRAHEPGRSSAGPSFDNQIATIDLDGRQGPRVTSSAPLGTRPSPPRLESWLERRLDRDDAASGPTRMPAPVPPVAPAP